MEGREKKGALGGGCRASRKMKETGEKTRSRKQREGEREEGRKPGAERRGRGGREEKREGAKWGGE